MKIIVTVVGYYQVSENDYVTDRISKVVGDDSIYELMEWARKVLGKSVFVNELQFSGLEDKV